MADSTTASGGATSTGKETMAEKNAKHFDKATIGDWPQWVLDLHAQIADFLTSGEFMPWIGLPANKSGRMLDYACGNGLICKSLKPNFASVVGIDVSTAMLERFQKTAADLGFGPDEMVGVRGDLLTDDVQPTEPPLPEEKLRDFDLVVTSMALHHFADPSDALRKLASRARPGGAVLVIDWAPLDASTPAQREYEEELRAKGETFDTVTERSKIHVASHTISKLNFSHQEMVELFEQAGCGDVRWKIAERLTPVPVVDAKFQLFFAGALKSS